MSDAAAVSAPSAAVVWHDLECGSYRADLPLWLELAQASDGPILDVGAGSGRVALRLARAGHAVIALDRDRELLDALAARAEGLDLHGVCADARDFELPERELALCVAPMQTLQLLGGSEQRSAFLRAARAHLRRGGLLACAIVTALESYDASAAAAPRPDVTEVAGVRYLSHPVSVLVQRERIVIERVREMIAVGAARSKPAAEQPRAERERSVVELDRVSVRQLEREARAAGLRPEPARQIAPTDDHVGSEVVMLRV
ncbi:MAG TPA: class I SAM-dependent methyltransferase [Solirubrobacteraceae bacterium]|nr:class I SAM-dependent methyltransferase [Solirubrobacteraceae bacterium]